MQGNDRNPTNETSSYPTIPVEECFVCGLINHEFKWAARRRVSHSNLVELLVHRNDLRHGWICLGEGFFEIKHSCAAISVFRHARLENRIARMICAPPTGQRRIIRPREIRRGERRVSREGLGAEETNLKIWLAHWKPKNHERNVGARREALGSSLPEFEINTTF